MLCEIKLLRMCKMVELKMLEYLENGEWVQL